MLFSNSEAALFSGRAASAPLFSAPAVSLRFSVSSQTIFLDLPD